MPRRDIDYKNTVIYKIACNDLTISFTYIGHTTDLTKRKNKHKSDCYNPNSKAYNLKLYTTIRENGGWSSWSVVLVEEYPCNNGEEARKRERFFYEFLNAELNTIRPIVYNEELKELNKQYRTDNAETIKEREKKYRTDNAETIKERKKQYYIDNAETIKEQRNQYYIDNAETIKEHFKQYYIDNAETIKELNKQYRINNADKINEKHSCECGGRYVTNSKSTHFKTKKHQIFIKNNGATI